MNVINVYKPISITPYQLIKSVREYFGKQLTDEKIAYAGRLDPMAHGVMLYLIGDETKNRDYYQKLTKTYKTKIIFGLATDTYDAMGLITKTTSPIDLENIKLESLSYCRQIQGLQLQKYPPFSYPKIKGVSMYKLAREGKLNKKDIPEKEIFIYSAKIGNFRKIFINDITDDVTNKIASVNGDFRQNKIIKNWQSLENSELITADASFEVSSGTYIRSLVNNLGVKTNTGAIAYDILRTSVGDYELKDSIRL